MKARLQRGQVERMRNAGTSAEFDVRGGDAGFKTIWLGLLHADQRFAIEVQLKWLAVELAGAAHFQRVAVGRVICLGDRYLSVEGQFADAIRQLKRAVDEGQLLD